MRCTSPLVAAMYYGCVNTFSLSQTNNNLTQTPIELHHFFDTLFEYNIIIFPF